MKEQIQNGLNKVKEVSAAAAKGVSGAVGKVTGGNKMENTLTLEVVGIRKYEPGEGKESGVKAFADLRYGDMIIKGFSVAENKSTKELFVQNPSQVGKDQKWHSRAFGRTDAFNGMIKSSILDAYKKL